MNSLDPWRLIVTDLEGDVIVPAPYYSHPFYQEIPSWIHYGDGGGTTRQLFDGVFVGAAPRRPGADMNAGHPRRGLVAEVAPVVAPATGGITFRKELDDKQVLHVEVCVDGKCYRSSMDLAPVIALIMAKLSRWHEDAHAQMDLAAQQTVVVGAVDAAVGAAVDAIVGELVGHHVDTVCGNFLGDIGRAVSSAASGLASGVASTFKKLKGPISAAAGIAAAAGAGPLVGPLAAKLANDLVNSAAGDSGAKKRVAEANQEAQTDPAVATALVQAQKAVATSTVAHHVQRTAKKAAQGQPDAQQQIVQVATDAEQGDPAAKAVADLIANAMHSEWGAKLWEKATARGPAPVDVASGQVVVGGFWDDVKSALGKVAKPAMQFIKDNHLESYVQRAASTVASYYGGPAAEAAAEPLSPMVMDSGDADPATAATASQNVQGVKRHARRRGRHLGRAADVAHGAIDQTATAYQVAQVTKDASAGAPDAQRVLAALRAMAAGGDQNAAKALQAVEAIASAQQQAPGAAVSGWYDIAGVVIGLASVGACPCPTVGAVPATVLGATLSDLQDRAQVLASAKPGAAVGVIHSKRDNTWYVYSLGSLDDAIDWLQRSTQDRAAFTYAAAFEKGPDGTPYVQAEEVGGSRRPAASPVGQFRRG